MRNAWVCFFSNDKNVAPKTKKYCEKDIAKWITGNMDTQCVRQVQDASKQDPSPYMFSIN